MRFITTNGVECLRPLDRKLYPIEELEDVHLEPTVFEPVSAPAFIESNPLNDFSPEQIISLVESVKELKEMKDNSEQDILAPEEFELNPLADTDPSMFESSAFGPNVFEPNAFGQAPEVININIMQPQQGQQQALQQGQQQGQQALQQGPPLPNVADMPSLFPEQGANVTQEQEVQMQPQQQVQMQPMQQVQQVQMQPQQQQQVQIQMQSQQQQQQNGGSQDRLINIPATPGAAPIIAVDTSLDAMERDGINYMGGGRPVRRRFQQNYSQPMQQGLPQQGNNSNSVGLLTITKLE